MFAIEPLVGHRKITASSNRAFAVVFAVVFAAVALMPLRHGDAIRWWALGVAVIILAVGLAAPQLLAPLNRLWFRFGRVLSRVTTPVVMAIVYYAAVVPTGLIMRACGKDPLRLRREPAAPTYWIVRKTTGPGSMSRQF
jgi:saxitoxin biosynthesis operon SxtJ-like protein